MNILVNGGVVCLTTHSNELLEIQAYNNGASNATNVTVNVGGVSGLLYQSHTASQGTYDPETGVWTVGTLTPSQNSGNPETLEICFTIVDVAEAPFEITFTIDCDQCPDDSPEDNSGTRTIEGLVCDDFADCITSVFGCLPSFVNMSEALTTVGVGQPFLAALNNTEGWSYRSLLITPSIYPLTLECPEDMVDNPCVSTCDGEPVTSGRSLTCSELQPVVTGPCAEATFVAIENYVDNYIDEGATYVGSSWDAVYLIPCVDCEGVRGCCCTYVTEQYELPQEEWGFYNIVTLHAEFVNDGPPTEGTVTFTFADGQCASGESCSYHFIGAAC